MLRRGVGSRHRWRASLAVRCGARECVDCRSRVRCHFLGKLTSWGESAGSSSPKPETGEHRVSRVLLNRVIFRVVSRESRRKRDRVRDEGRAERDETSRAPASRRSRQTITKRVTSVKSEQIHTQGGLAFAFRGASCNCFNSSKRVRGSNQKYRCTRFFLWQLRHVQKVHSCREESLP